MKLICAWCKVVLLTGEVPASHGICLVCKLKLEGDTSGRASVASLLRCSLMSIRMDQLRFCPNRVREQSGILAGRVSDEMKTRNGC